MAISISITSRRALLGAFAMTPLLAVPMGTAFAVSMPTPFRIAADRYYVAQHRLNQAHGEFERNDPVGDERLSRAFNDALTAVESAQIATWAEFTELFGIAFDDGESIPMEETVRKLLADARRLCGTVRA